MYLPRRGQFEFLLGQSARDGTASSSPTAAAAARNSSSLTRGAEQGRGSPDQVGRAWDRWGRDDCTRTETGRSTERCTSFCVGFGPLGEIL